MSTMVPVTLVGLDGHTADLELTEKEVRAELKIEVDPLSNVPPRRFRLDAKKAGRLIYREVRQHARR